MELLLLLLLLPGGEPSSSVRVVPRRGLGRRRGPSSSVGRVLTVMVRLGVEGSVVPRRREGGSDGGPRQRGLDLAPPPVHNARRLARGCQGRP